MHLLQKLPLNGRVVHVGLGAHLHLEGLLLPRVDLFADEMVGSAAAHVPPGPRCRADRGARVPRLPRSAGLALVPVGEGPGALVGPASPGVPAEADPGVIGHQRVDVPVLGHVPRAGEVGVLGSAVRPGLVPRRPRCRQDELGGMFL